MSEPIDESKLSRVVLVDYTRRDGTDHPLHYEEWDVHIELSVQDDGRTLKVFVDNF